MDGYSKRSSLHARFWGIQDVYTIVVNTKNIFYQYYTAKNNLQPEGTVQV